MSWSSDRKRAAVVIAVLGTLATGTALAHNQGEDYGRNGVFEGCVDKHGNLRLVTNARDCKKQETYVTWHQRGPTGAAGAPGAQGPMGPMGPMGAMGPMGPAGANGANGAVGPMGPVGATGATGAQGPAGANGADGAPGAQGPMGLQGLMGPMGPAGPAGANGADGAPGAMGPAGPQGIAGATGAAGPEGPQGPAGPPGGAPPEPAQTSFLSTDGDAFLRIDDVRGPSLDARHREWFELSGWGQRIARKTTTEGSTVSIGLAAGLLFGSSLTGLPAVQGLAATQAVVRSVTLELVKATGDAPPQRFFTITLTNARLASSGVYPSDAGTSVPLTFAFEKIEWTYREQNPNGSLGTQTTVSYDVLTGAVTGATSPSSLDFFVGGTVSPPLVKALSFAPPPTPSTLPAEATMLLDVPVLQNLVALLRNDAIPSSTVVLRTPTNQEILRYGFSSSRLETMTLSGTNAALRFHPAATTITVGPDKATYPPAPPPTYYNPTPGLGS